VVPVDPIRLAARGPATGAQLDRTSRPLQPTDRLAVTLRNPREDAPRLLGCVIAGVQARLPPDGPAVLAPDDVATARLSALVDAVDRDGTLGAEAASMGFDWLLTVEDTTSRDPVPWDKEGALPLGFGFGVGQSVSYTLKMFGQVFDLRTRRQLGTVWARYDASGGTYVVAGFIAALPFVLPVVVLPGGTTAMSICAAFGRVLGATLLQATTPAPSAEAVSSP
jgi:hypothetical protein